jgi:hypothetical protein
MVAKVHGNTGATNYGGSRGIGQASIPDGTIGWVGVTGNAIGDVAYLKAADCTSMDRVQQGYFFQCTGGGATVDFTLAPEAQATNPDPAVQAMVPWSNTLTFTTTAIQKSPVAFSAIRVTFTAPGAVFCVSR